MTKKPDLSGRWLGTFNYPLIFPSNDFEAILRETNGSLTGATMEMDDRPGRGGFTLHAVIGGRRSGHSVTFRKIYDDLVMANDPVDYVGELGEDGNEIVGRWTIRKHFSGTFIMVRHGLSEAAEKKRESVETGA